MEAWLRQAGWRGSEYLLDGRLRDRPDLADPILSLDVALRSLRQIIDSMSMVERDRIRQSNGRLPMLLEADATMWWLIVEDSRGVVWNAYLWDHQ